MLTWNFDNAVGEDGSTPLTAVEKTAAKKEYDDGIPNKTAAGTGMCMQAGKTAHTGENKSAWTYKCV
jgi:hypothetical protein